ncbi:platelet-derived growth factor subunit A-like [Lytechinus variegatus]|uniref:platelet-derived growth factor subunit A-like n=1 Tax=Lytechinus variegatus TaxID=7654 RepID=UPI001BB296F1|nr:platelet-derived growth factor subunit A-like [Lytechinus variegatus]
MNWNYISLLGWIFLQLITENSCVKNEIPSSLLYELKDVHTIDDLMKVIYIQPNQAKEFMGSSPIDRRIPPKMLPIIPRQSSEESEEDTAPASVTSYKAPAMMELNFQSMDGPASMQMTSIAEMPRCEPRPTILTTSDVIDEGIVGNEVEYAIYWPPCITINRCGGCCSTEILQCVPNNTRTREMQVLRLTAHQRSPQIQLSGLVSVSVQEDESCSCECKVKPQDCHPTREIYRNCQCECNVEYECPDGMIWDATRCDCICNTPIHERTCRRRKHYFNEDICGCQCLERLQRGCQSPYVFNPQTCKCQFTSRSKRRPFSPSSNLP